MARPQKIAWFAVMMLLAVGTAALADGMVREIIQKGRRFNLAEVEINVGDTLRFSNEDEFLHQIYVKSAEFNFESAEQPPGQTVDVKFTKIGTFSVLCEIHPKMHLTVTVK